ncbi:stage II sporulation protein R [Clostridium sp. SHJSY1]|uniref:stage II sporulation protein R n=1 Tax=Clostridium sp. SHJSY1 TaxID=2942483 RepID=UPI002874ABFA|nr:stage II sporulation protein R [Clostridium sp. SHJSY1]MDS0528287.1 stage II sporulation protein R [Clostridium sp. SHJSY1]
MRRNFSLLIILILFVSSSLTGCTSISFKADGGNVYNYDDVKDALIRFHVIANSDTDEDQSLKYKVRDEVINYLYPYLEDSKSLEDSRRIIKENEDKVENIALKVIKNNGYSYSVKTELSNENFPEKSYGNITLPQGNYEAFRVIIGNGEGQNWWCVMFPPLCFIDVTKGNVEQEKSKDELDREIDKNKNIKEEENPKIKFKIVEVFKDIFK